MKEKTSSLNHIDKLLEYSYSKVIRTANEI